MRSNKIKKSLLLAILLITISSNCFSASFNEVEEIREDIIEDLEEKANQAEKNRLVGEEIASFFSDKDEFFEAMFTALKYAFIATIIGIILFFIIRFLTSRRRDKRRKIEKSMKIDSNLGIHFNQADWDNFVLKGSWSEGIVYLQRCAVYLLLDNKIAFMKNITNRTLAKRITRKDLRNLFMNLSIESELILFDDKKANRLELEKAFEEWEQFKRGFIA